MAAGAKHLGVIISCRQRLRALANDWSGSGVEGGGLGRLPIFHLDPDAPPPDRSPLWCWRRRRRHKGTRKTAVVRARQCRRTNTHTHMKGDGWNVLSFPPPLPNTHIHNNPPPKKKATTKKNIIIIHRGCIVFHFAFAHMLPWRKGDFKKFLMNPEDSGISIYIYIYAFYVFFSQGSLLPD